MTSLIFKRPPYEKVQEEMRNLFTGKRKREGKVAMQAVSKYYFFEERTKAHVK